jgi:hypothetical protein
MTSGNDKKGPPGRPVPQRPAGPATGGAAGRPAPRPAPPPAGGRPLPAAPPRPAASYSADEDKTSALDISSLGLDADESTVAADGAGLRARAAAMPADDEKTTAFNLADLPPDDEPRRSAQKTLLGYPGQRGGPPVRGGASAPAPRPAAPPAFEEEKTQAMSVADIAKIDALPPRPAKPAPPAFEEEKTTAMSIADIAKIDDLPPRPAAKPPATPARPQAAPPPPRAPAPARPAQIAEEERTMAVNLDDFARHDAGRPGARPAAQPVDDERTMAVNLEDMRPKEPPRKPAAIAKASAQAPAPRAAAVAEVSDEKTTAMSLDDLEKLDTLMPRRRAEAAAPARSEAPAAGTAGPEMADGEGFAGSIAYALQHDAVEAKGSGARLDAGRKAAGMRNLIIVGAAIAIVITVVGIIW